MKEENLVISPKRYKGDTYVVSARLPQDMVATLDRASKETGRTRNEIIALCLEFALERLVINGRVEEA